MQQSSGDNLEFLITMLVIVWFINKIIKPSRRRKKFKTIEKNKPVYSPIVIPITTGYQRAQFLTANEYKAYFALKRIAEEKGLIVCPKVRLLDIVEPQYNVPKRQVMLSKVMSKHVDFVICKPDMQIFAIVELDDRTHLRPDRIQRDQFVDSVLHSVGYPVIHTYAITSDIFDSIQ